MTFDFTLFAAFQVLGGLCMYRRIQRSKQQRLRVSSALKGWVRDGDIYFTLGDGR